MLERLSLKHSLWVKMAKGICKDAYLADDLVSEMYIKFSEYDKDKEVNDYYVYFAIKHLYINYLRDEKKFQMVELHENIMDIEVTDVIHLDIKECKDLTWVDREILLKRTEMSGREIGNKYHLNYQSVHRIENKAKEKLKIWLTEKLRDSEI